MKDFFETYEKNVRPDLAPPPPPEKPNEDEMFHDDDEPENKPTEIDYEKLAAMVAEKLKGGGTDDGTGATDTTDNQ